MILEEFCGEFHALLEKKPVILQILEEGQRLLQNLLREAEWFGDILTRLISDRSFLEAQEVSVFPNEITLYRSPDRSFVILGYLWEPHTLCVIHDHSSWGILGSLVQETREIKYRRLDDGQKPGYAALQEEVSRIIPPGSTAPVFPLNKGIHQTGSAADRWAVSLGVYGGSLRRGYIQFYYPAQKKVIRAYPPKIHKRVMALHTMASAAELSRKGFSLASLTQPLPRYLAEEFRRFSGSDPGGQKKD